MRITRIPKPSLSGLVLLIPVFLSIIAVLISLRHGWIVAYGDSESHLNIAKRIIHSLTPGVAQLGGIWLPLPHILMVPFVSFDPLWRSGLAGSIISGASYVLSCIYLYRLTLLVTQNKPAAFVAFLVIALNPNILYMQTTPMTELPLMAFFIMSSFYFIRFMEDDRDIMSLIAAAFFAFCASLTRYDGWFLVMIEASVIFLYYFREGKWRELEGKFILFVTLAFFGIGLWLLWNFLILGDPLYFTNSPFSAKSQQNAWAARGELPAYSNFPVALQYYAVTMLRNLGWVAFILAVFGAVLFLLGKFRNKPWVFLLLGAPFIFNVVTLYMGQSVIFIPDLTPASFEWRLFNVRYGMMMVPTLAFFIGVLYSFGSSRTLKAFVLIVFALQLGLFASGREQIITLDDGLVGLSASKHPDAESWIKKNYDGGYVLLDDYARTISVLRSDIPMQNIIYIGNKPYWEDSLREPEKYVRWIVLQQDDTVWKSLYADPAMQKHLYKYFTKDYTSPKILIFRRNTFTSLKR